MVSQSENTFLIQFQIIYNYNIYRLDLSYYLLYFLL